VEPAERQMLEVKERSRFPAAGTARDDQRYLQEAHDGFELFLALIGLVLPRCNARRAPEDAEDRRSCAGLGFLKESTERGADEAHLPAWRVASPGGLFRGPVLPAPRASRGGL
jgi:hypothetical protein